LPIFLALGVSEHETHFGHTTQRLGDFRRRNAYRWMQRPKLRKSWLGRRSCNKQPRSASHDLFHTRKNLQLGVFHDHRNRIRRVLDHFANAASVDRSWTTQRRGNPFLQLKLRRRQHVGHHVRRHGAYLGLHLLDDLRGRV
jgi:hypothetical protein